MTFYKSSKEEVIKALETDEKVGLSTKKVDALRGKYGENKLKEK